MPNASAFCVSINYSYLLLQIHAIRERQRTSYNDISPPMPPMPTSKQKPNNKIHCTPSNRHRNSRSRCACRLHRNCCRPESGTGRMSAHNCKVLRSGAVQLHRISQLHRALWAIGCGRGKHREFGKGIRCAEGRGKRWTCTLKVECARRRHHQRHPGTSLPPVAVRRSSVVTNGT